MAARQNIGLVGAGRGGAAGEGAELPRSRLRARPADQRRRAGRQVGPRRAAADLDRPRGSADHRRRARPAERGAARDRDAGHASRPRRRRATRPTRRSSSVMSGGWHQGVIGIVAGRLKERFGRPAIVIAETEDGTGKGSGRSICGRRPRRGGARRQGQRPADRRRRPCDGGRADAAAGRARAVPRLHQRAARPPTSRKSRGDRALLLDALLAPGGVAGALCDALDAAGPYGAGWPSPRVAAGPVRLIKTGIVGDGHVRGHRVPATTARASSGSPSAAPRPTLGQALLASPARHALVARRDDQARRVERRQCGRDAPRGRRACLTLSRPLA